MRTAGRRLTLAAAITVGAAVAAGAVIAGSAEDDLTVVKRAVRVSQDAPARVAPAPPASDDSAVRADDKDKEWRSETRHTANRDLRWFKVRVTEKGSKRSRVNINLPIALVRALDDFPVDIGRHGRWHDEGRTLRLGEVLATLEGGQSLVEIDDDEATVRVWVE